MRSHAPLLYHGSHGGHRPRGRRQGAAPPLPRVGNLLTRLTVRLGLRFSAAEVFSHRNGLHVSATCSPHSRSHTQVASQIKTNNVVVFAKTYCPYCQKGKRASPTVAKIVILTDPTLSSTTVKIVIHIDPALPALSQDSGR